MDFLLNDRVTYYFKLAKKCHDTYEIKYHGKKAVLQFRIIKYFELVPLTFICWKNGLLYILSVLNLYYGKGI